MNKQYRAPQEDKLQTITRNRDKQEGIGLLEEERKAVLFGDAAENGKSRLEYDANHEIFLQGEPAESVFYLGQGMVELSVISPEGKEAIVATLGSGEFFGEECLAGQRERLATATTVTPCALPGLRRS